MIDMPTQELQVFAMIKTLCLNWPATRTVQVTLFEHDSASDRAPLVKLQIKRKSRNDFLLEVFKIQEWNYSHVSAVMDDWDACTLDYATQSSCSSLVSLMFDTSKLTENGLEFMQRAVKQSNLQFLYIECGTIDVSLARHLGQVLEAVNWSALKSLKLSGDNVDGWIDLWARHGNILNLAPFELHFLRLSMVGSNRQGQRLSHSSALWIHNLIYLFSPVEVLLKNIKLQEAGDWELIQGAADDPSSLRLSLINCSNAHNV